MYIFTNLINIYQLLILLYNIIEMDNMSIKELVNVYNRIYNRTEKLD